MADNVFTPIPVPGFDRKDEVVPDEILYSTVGLTQKGGVFASGQGILPAGTVVGRKTSDKKWRVYSDAASDGTEVARGILRDTIDTTDGDVMGNIVLAGMLKNDKLSGLDSAAITDLNGRQDTVLNLFAF